MTFQQWVKGLESAVLRAAWNPAFGPVFLNNLLDTRDWRYAAIRPSVEELRSQWVLPYPAFAAYCLRPKA